MNNRKQLVNLLRNSLWAKTEPFKPLWMHLIETGIIAQELISTGCFVPLAIELERYLGVEKEEVLALVGYMAAIHDLGKCHALMQGKGVNTKIEQIIKDNKLNVFSIEGFRHEEYGGIRLAKIWHKKERFSNRKVRTRFAAVIKLHHQGKKMNNASSIGGEDERDVIWEALQEELEEKVWEIFHPTDVRPLHLDAVCMMLLGIVITADWIASGDDFALLSAYRTEESTIHQARIKMKEFLKNNYLLHHPASAEINSFTKLWPNIPRERMRPLQQMVDMIFEDETEMPLGVILEAPMGCGKTEAGLYVACRLAQRWRKEGFYVALPTAATSNQMYDRMNVMLKGLNNPRAKLMHSMAWLMDENERSYHTEAESDVQLWTSPMRRGLISPFAVGTVDQTMMSVMRTKYGVLRLAGLVQKVLIIDELHSYDAYMGTIIESLLKWCRVLHVPVVMLSATLSLDKKESFARCYEYQEDILDPTVYPAVTLLYNNKPLKQIAVQEKKHQMQVHIEIQHCLEQSDDIAKLVKRKMGDEGGCCCVLLNTVSEAQEVYAEIRRLLPEMPCILFHARFSAIRRQEIERECLTKLSCAKEKRPKNLIVVATQVVEQSLDLDFDYMISDICPIDLLLQRLGRLWRHVDTPRPPGMIFPELIVLVPEDEDYKKTGIVYPEILLQRSAAELKKYQVVSLPEDIPVMVQHVYNGYALDKASIEEWMKYQIVNDQQRIEAEQQRLPDPDAESFCLTDSLPKLGNMFYSDEDTAFLSVQTRLGEVSRRVAIIPIELYVQVSVLDKPKRRIAKEVLGYSVNVAERKIKRFFLQKCADGRIPLDGKGLLLGTWILPGNGGKCAFQDGTVLEMNKELGFLIRREDENEL